MGGLLVLELLERDADAEVLCLTRPRATLSAQERLLTALRDAARVYGRPMALRHMDRRCTAVPGDLSQVTDSAVTERIGAVDHVWHSAASLAFEDEARDDIMRINVEGTRNLADLAQRLHVSTFNHISTAYVAGQRVGTFPPRRWTRIACAPTTCTSTPRYWASRSSPAVNSPPCASCGPVWWSAIPPLSAPPPSADSTAW
ncbi:NAD-dependent epimerase/dehydratase family protein [Streptomyces sp. SID4944]|nr:NAD-dependent epimerase/dehydratase family protein [Streptomyces sp. SID4944]